MRQIGERASCGGGEVSAQPVIHHPMQFHPSREKLVGHDEDSKILIFELPLHRFLALLQADVALGHEEVIPLFLIDDSARGAFVENSQNGIRIIRLNLQADVRRQR